MLISSFRNRCLSAARLLSTSKVLILANQAPNNTVFTGLSNVFSAANKLGAGTQIHVLVGGKSPLECKWSFGLGAVSKLFAAKHEDLGTGIPEFWIDLVSQLHRQECYSHIFAPSNSFGKAVIPCVAHELKSNAISEICEILSPNSFSRVMYGGNVIGNVVSNQAKGTPVVATIHYTSFPRNTESGKEPEILEISPVPMNPVTKSIQFLQDIVNTSKRPDLSAASVVVCCGRGAESILPKIEELTDTVDGAIGATRSLVDAHMLPNDLQIGQTGRVIAPKVYIGAGISGMIQHIAGIKDSKTIVAINKDKEAPIFRYADYGVIGVCEEEIPKLNELLKAKKPIRQ